MKKKRLFYKKGKTRVRIFLLSSILIFSGSTFISMHLMTSAKPRSISLLAGSESFKKQDKPLDNSYLENIQKNISKHSSNEESQKEETNIISEQNIEQVESDASPICGVSVAAEEVFSFGRDVGKKYVFLTFDDGPNSSITPKILEILKKANIPATFFVVGSAVDNYPEVLKQLFNDGHAIANHTYSHNYKILYPNKTVDIEAFFAEIEKTNKSIIDAIGDGSSSRVIRFPAGSFEKWKRPMKDELIKAGMYYLDWNAENRDGLKNNATIEEQLNSVTENISTAESSKKNVVLLMHDSATKQTTVDALPFIIELLQAKGYEFGTIK